MYVAEWLLTSKRILPRALIEYVMFHIAAETYPSPRILGFPVSCVRLAGLSGHFPRQRPNSTDTHNCNHANNADVSHLPSTSKQNQQSLLGSLIILAVGVNRCNTTPISPSRNRQVTAVHAEIYKGMSGLLWCRWLANCFIA
jgi:hypothetical protein